MAREKTPPWVYVGCGCVALIGLAIAGVTVFGFLGVSKMQSYVEDLENPQTRGERVARILGARELPEGYNPQFYLSVPFVFDMAVLSDAPVEETTFEGESAEWSMGRRGFVFMAIRDFDGDRQRVRAELESDSPNVDLEDLQQDIDVGIDFRSEEVLARGRLEIGSQEILYVTQRGELESRGDRVRGLYTQLLVACPDDEKLRLGWWYEAEESLDPTTGAVDEEAGVSDVPAVEAPAVEAPAVEVVEAPASEATEVAFDEAALRAFFGQLNLCSV